MHTEHQSLITSLYDIGAIQFGEFTLKSGQISPIYLNLRKIISYPTLLQLVANAIWEKIKTYHSDLICGVPYTALPIATCLSLNYNLPMIMRRKEKKDYGTKQTIEGVFKAGQSCLIIEDVITTGSSILETANELETVGLKIKNVVALIDREQGGRTNLEKQFQTHTILSLTSILETLLHTQYLNAEEQNVAREYLLTKSARVA